MPQSPARPRREPRLTDVLNDPLVALMLSRHGKGGDDLLAMMERLRSRVAAWDEGSDTPGEASGPSAETAEVGGPAESSDLTIGEIGPSSLEKASEALTMDGGNRMIEFEFDHGEPSLDELFDDPVMRLIMDRDGVRREDILDLKEATRNRVSARSDQAAA